MNAASIQHALISDRWLRSFVIPNFTPKHWFECDVFEVTKAGYFVEYEVKISKSDFHADATKARRHYDRDWNPTTERKHELLAVADHRGPSRFFFVTPPNLVNLEEIPPWAGWIVCHQDEKNPNARIYPTTLKPAPTLHRIKLETDRHDDAFKTCYWRFLRLYLKNGKSGVSAD